MHIRYGYTIDVVFDRSADLVTRLDIHMSRRSDITEPDDMLVTALADGAVVASGDIEQDRFGNLCRRLAVPAGGVRLAAEGIVYDSGFTDPPPPDGRILPPEQLSPDVRAFLDDSPLCATPRFAPVAKVLLAERPAGPTTIQAIIDHVHDHLRFDPGRGRPGRTAEEAYDDQAGGSEDFAQVAVALCRAAGIPARYCTGYHADIGPAQELQPGFNAWFDAHLDGRWWAFDARTNAPRIGRILVARGRDSSDVSILSSAGTYHLAGFEISADEVTGARFPVTSRERRARWTGHETATAAKLAPSR
ncbi:transglutaminase family protein [Phreatobacter aquaticus]|uniref:Transglutaminase family protein n=1 Tax=Phreatobacter aquaticus TaxID=2570229 RepID=A0A4D7QMQ6_9HYPH|nr:transglutaminase family protein [Phreatobacter aquaticus]QCK86909.1 transglutaminase family protein [Phreatobacter aquaticus]